MKKKFMSPYIKIFNVRSNNIVVTSDIAIGDDIEEGSTDAPRRSRNWEDYQNR